MEKDRKTEGKRDGWRERGSEEREKERLENQKNTNTQTHTHTPTGQPSPTLVFSAYMKQTQSERTHTL